MPPGSPISFWRMDEASGTRFDSVGDNDLTDINTVASGIGKRNFGADFEAANSEKLQVDEAGGATNFDFTTTFSVAFWVKFETVTGTHTLFTKSKNAGNQRTYIFYFDGTDLNLRLSGNGTATETESVSWTPTVDTWYHLAVTYNAGSVIFYVNGFQWGVTQTSAVTSIFNGDGDFVLGGDAEESGKYLDGILDDVIVYSSVLTASQIQQIMNLFSWDTTITDVAGTPVDTYSNSLGLTYSDATGASIDRATPDHRRIFNTDKSATTWINVAKSS